MVGRIRIRDGSHAAHGPRVENRWCSVYNIYIYLDFCVFVDFPFISYGQSFLTEEHKCNNFFTTTSPAQNMPSVFFVFTFQMP